MNDNQVQVDLSWLLQQIAAIQNDTEYLKEGLAHLSQMNVGGKTAPYEPEDVAGRAKAEALRDIIRGREATNQKLLALYEKMYDDCVHGSLRQTAVALHADLAKPDEPAAEETEAAEH